MLFKLDYPQGTYTVTVVTTYKSMLKVNIILVLLGWGWGKKIQPMVLDKL